MVFPGAMRTCARREVQGVEHGEGLEARGPPESWTSPIYYGVRLTHYFEARRDWGVMLDFFHDKVFADTEAPVRVTGTRGGEPVEGMEPLGTTVRRFNMSHGMNYLTLDVVHRCNTCPEPGCTGRLQPYVGAGAGLVIPHVEAAVGEQSVGEYQVWLKVEGEHPVDEEAGAGLPVGSSREREAGAGGASEELRPLRLAETISGVDTGAGAAAAAVREGGAGRGASGVLLR
ncbi:MAG TPA: hypothetical protein VK458_28745 [Myxococcaceae bacterium]|nr:hypothetical protein [Myxococcaceae bacterium]